MVTYKTVHVRPARLKTLLIRVQASCYGPFLGEKGALATGTLAARLSSIGCSCGMFPSPSINGDLMSTVISFPLRPWLVPVVGVTSTVIRLVSVPLGPPLGTALPQWRAGTAHVLSVAARLPGVSWR